MAILRRLKLLFSCFLAALLVSGSSLPSLALWQCHHARQVVSAAFLAQPSAMPCRMKSAGMAGMSCCQPPKTALKRSALSRQAMSRPACQPTLVRLAAIPAVGTPENQTHLRQTLASMQTTALLPSTHLPSVPVTVTLRQRPPPTLRFSLSPSTSLPGLRAPPLS